jgi:hypothetical protein
MSIYSKSLADSKPLLGFNDWDRMCLSILPDQSPEHSGLCTTTGCWTCRMRRGKCDDIQPFCGPCQFRALSCHGFGPKPVWMDSAELTRKQSRKNQTDRVQSSQGEHFVSQRSLQYLHQTSYGCKMPDKAHRGAPWITAYHVSANSNWRIRRAPLQPSPWLIPHLRKKLSKKFTRSRSTQTLR